MPKYWQELRQNIEQIMKDFERDYWMDAKEAVEYGIVDRIVEKI